MDPKQTQTEDICLDIHLALSKFPAEAFSNIKKGCKSHWEGGGVDSSKITKNLNTGVQKLF